MQNKLIKVCEYLTVYGIGAALYGLIEILFRGFTHWTMLLTGGMCLAFFHAANKKLKNRNIWQKCLAGSAIITFIEFIVGIAVNRILCWNVWNYSDRFLNICGQICPLFSIIWFLLCVPAVMISNFIDLCFNGKQNKPEHIMEMQ